MRKFSLTLFSIVVVAILLSYIQCSLKTGIKPTLSYGHSQERWVEKVSDKMTLEEKIGQMIFCRYSGRFLNRNSDELERILSLILKQKIGGFILFGGNVYETAYLTNAMQSVSDIPLLIASDLERGLGNQIEGAVLFPPLMSVGATDSQELAYKMGEITALEARALGIHMTFSPVVDVNINPENPIINTRSFGEKPEQVGLLAQAFIKGCQENGLLATAKHFPGHGDTDLDSHNVLAVVEGNRKRLNEVELYPFKKAIDAGVQAIMTAHISLPAIDPVSNRPATLSPVILNGLLRKEMGFEGIIVTDAMDMGGITKIYSAKEAAKKAVIAGVDCILLPPEPEDVIESLVQAVRKGEISENRIDLSVQRILRAKARVGLNRNRKVNLELLDNIISSERHIQCADEIFEKSITLVKNNDHILPLSDKKVKAAIFSLSSDPGDYYAGSIFVNEIKKLSHDSSEFYAELSTGKKYIQEAFEKNSEADIFIFALFSRVRAWKGNVGLQLNHINIIKEALKKSMPVVVVSFGSPYFLKHFPDVDAYVCAYRYSPMAQIMAAKALYGHIEVSGMLPVSIPECFPAGHGLVLPKKILEKKIIDLK
ncbi:MAG: glycoside hydrolase family 3 N-terminal domain-containing protein [Candidatus Aminicenantaceae bacterium]